MRPPPTSIPIHFLCLLLLPTIASGISCLKYENLRSRLNATEPWRATTTERQQCQADWCMFVEGVGNMQTRVGVKEVHGRMYGCTTNEAQRSMCQRVLREVEKKRQKTGKSSPPCAFTDQIFDVLHGDWKICCCAEPGCTDGFEARPHVMVEDTVVAAQNYQVDPRADLPNLSSIPDDDDDDDDRPTIVGLQYMEPQNSKAESIAISTFVMVTASVLLALVR